MKKNAILGVLLLFNAIIVNAQFNVTLNGKKVAAGQEFNYADIKNLTVSFSNPQELPTYSDGYVMLLCSFLDESGLKENIKYIAKKIEGASSINAFLNQKLPKTYSLYPYSEEPDFIKYSFGYFGGSYSSDSKTQFSDICESYKFNRYGGKVKLKFKMEYHELTGSHYDPNNGQKYNDYGKAVELIEPFEMFVKIADKNAFINCNSINAKFKLADIGNIGFVKIDSSGKWSKVKNISANNSPTDICFVFENTRINIANLVYTNTRSSAENLAEFKTLSDRLSYTQANLCNRNLDEKELQKLVDMGITSFFNFYNNTILERFDKKNNKNAESETIWESFTLNNISGFKAVNTLKTNKCSERKPLYGGYGPADPAQRKLNGSSVVYVFINPANPQSLLVFSYIQTEGNFNENLAKEKSVFMEKFISVLNFSK
ncbi:MAG: hypothetical protein JNJ41_01045 [Bacteroidia bacterium]|nr:hypothetical protein [Bacteroidia bacterium]